MASCRSASRVSIAAHACRLWLAVGPSGAGVNGTLASHLSPPRTSPAPRATDPGADRGWTGWGFCIKVVDAPPPLQVEAVDRPPLAVVAPDPPGDPIPPAPPTPSPPSPLPSPPPAPEPPTPPGPIAAEAHAASVREAAIARRRPRAAGPRRPPAPVPPPTVIH
jgi:hypothetical protein